MTVVDVDSKQTIYVSIVFSAFFVGAMLQLGPLIGAPLSFVALAYFSPKLSKKIICAMFVVLTLMNVLVDFSSWVAGYSVGRNYLVGLGLGENGIWIDGFLVVVFVSGFSFGRALSYGVAKKIIQRSKLWQRYPVG